MLVVHSALRCICKPMSLLPCTAPKLVLLLLVVLLGVAATTLDLGFMCMQWRQGWVNIRHGLPLLLMLLRLVRAVVSSVRPLLNVHIAAMLLPLAAANRSSQLLRLLLLLLFVLLQQLLLLKLLE